MSARPLRGLILLTGGLLAACAWPGPLLEGQPGLQWQLQSFYGTRAIEANAMCPQPQMTAITNSRVVMDLRYHFWDEAPRSMLMVAASPAATGSEGAGSPSAGPASAPLRSRA
jgi:hypothetical protein